VLTRDVVFSSPSLAGAVMIGRSCNGRISWVSDDGNFGQWEARTIAPVPEGVSRLPGGRAECTRRGPQASSRVTTLRGRGAVSH